jgi:hypothetical protein
VVEAAHHATGEGILALFGLCKFGIALLPDAQFHFKFGLIAIGIFQARLLESS